MFKFFYFFTGICTSTNNESINTTESVASDMNENKAKNKYQYDQILNGNNSTNQFSEQGSYKLEKIIGNTLGLEKESRPKSTQGSVEDNPFFDTVNFKCVQDNNNITNIELLENPIIKKLKLDNNSKCITSENARHPVQIFQISPNIYYSSTSSRFKSQKQYDEVLNSDKAINDQSKGQNDNIKCEEITTYEDKKNLLIKFYYTYIEKFNAYKIARKNLNYNLVFQNKTVQPNNQQMTNLDLLMDFCREVLGHVKSSFDKAKNEKFLISKKDFFYVNIDKKFISKLSKDKRLYFLRKVSLNNSVEYQIKKIEDNSFFKESSCESIKELIVECDMFLKEVVKYFLSFTLAAKLQERNFKLIYNECKDISQRITNISQNVQLECIVIIIKMLIEGLECSYAILNIDYNLRMLFNSVTHLSTDIKWLISPLKNIMDSIDKEYECRESN